MNQLQFWYTGSPSKASHSKHKSIESSPNRPSPTSLRYPPWRKPNELEPIDEQIELYRRTCGDKFDINEEINQLRQTEDALLKQFYEKRTLLLAIYRKNKGEAAGEVASPVKTASIERFSRRETTKGTSNLFKPVKTDGNEKVIPIFSARTNCMDFRSESREKKDIAEQQAIKVQEVYQTPRLEALHFPEPQVIQPVISIKAPSSSKPSNRFIQSVYIEPPKPKTHALSSSPPKSLPPPPPPSCQMARPKHLDTFCSQSQPPYEPAASTSKSKLPSSYFELQQNRLDRQKLHVNWLNRKLQQQKRMQNRSAIVGEYQQRQSERRSYHNTFNDDTFDKHPLSETSTMRGADTERACNEFMYLLSESILLEDHLERLRRDMQTHMPEVLKILGADKKVSIAKLAANVAEVMLKGQWGRPQAHRRMEAEQLLRKMFPNSTYTNSSDVLKIFAVKSTSHSFSSSPTSHRYSPLKHPQTRSNLRKYFTSLSQLLYFQQSLRDLASNHSTQIFNLVDGLHKGQQFSPSDLSEHLVSAIHSQISSASAMVFLSRRLRKGHQGKFEKSKFMLWLMDK